MERASTQAWTGMIHGEGDFSGSIKEDCALRNRSLTQMSLSQGRVALQSDRLRNAQSVIDTIIARAKTCLTCGICDAAVAREGRSPERPIAQRAISH
ncbi:MAG: hypothetical protein J6W23_01240 [Victivallales bacterium]|nr:hypothetical protein [Victivallales bacterium]